MYNNDDKRTSYNREVNQVPNETNSRNTETINNRLPEEYRDGYVHGRVAERRYNDDRQVVRDNNNSARGLLLGIVLTSLVALPALAYYLWNRQNQEPVVTPDPTPAPSIVVPSPQPERTIIQRERVIERNPEVQVLPVPQGQTPPAPAPTPNINIEQPAPAPQPTPNVNITVPPTTGQQQSTDTTQQSPANQQRENRLPATSTQQLPSVQNSPSSGASDTTNPSFGDQSDTSTPGNNASPSDTGNSSPAEQ